MNKIYTKTGDTGTTGLYDGERVAKTDPRIDTAGTIDELNSWLGKITAQQRAEAQIQAPEIIAVLKTVQRDLFVIGSQLTTPENFNNLNQSKLPTLTITAVTALEQSIDAMTRDLPTLREFILPGGSAISCNTHIARTVCRRAERQLVALTKTIAVDPIILQYCNRLSDWLFTLARFYNAKLNQPELTWK